MVSLSTCPLLRRRQIAPAFIPPVDATTRGPGYRPLRGPFSCYPGQMVTDARDTGLVPTIGVLEQARASFARRSCGEAYQQLATADAATPLHLDDLERLALAGYLRGLDEESTLAWTRAHQEAIRRNDVRRARRVA